MIYTKTGKNRNNNTKKPEKNNQSYKINCNKKIVNGNTTLNLSFFVSISLTLRCFRSVQFHADQFVIVPFVVAFVIEIIHLGHNQFFILFFIEPGLSYSTSGLLLANWPLVNNKPICDSVTEPVLFVLVSLEIG